MKNKSLHNNRFSPKGHKLITHLLSTKINSKQLIKIELSHNESFIIFRNDVTKKY